MEDLNVYLGKSGDQDIIWNPNKERNQHFLVVGTSGSGKTECLKSIIFELRRNKVPCMIIDFHNEYRKIAENSINMRKLTINPLDVNVGRRPQDVVYEVANVIKKIMNLGDRQESLLRNAIRRCFEDANVDLKEKVGPEFKSPGFMEVRQNVKELENSTNRSVVESLLNRIEPLFEIDVFEKDTTVIPFEEIFNKTTTIELKDFPTEDVKSVIAEFFLNKLIYHLYALDKTEKIRFYCVIDEAHRLTYEDSPMDRLLRESRKYGTGVILSSQRPSDFSETVLANCGGILSLQCNLEKDAKFIGQQLGINHEDVKGLTEPGVGFLKTTSSNSCRKVKILRVEDRLSPEELQKMEKEMITNTKKTMSTMEKMAETKRTIAKLRRDLENALQKEESKDKRIARLEGENSKLYATKREITRLNRELQDLQQIAKTKDDKISKMENENSEIRKTIDTTEKERFKMKMEKLSLEQLLKKHMKCKKCGTQNENDSIHCHECGKEL